MLASWQIEKEIHSVPARCGCLCMQDYIADALHASAAQVTPVLHEGSFTQFASIGLHLARTVL